MALCVLHIGMHKTGSTAIQAALHKAVFAGRQRWVDLGAPNHSRALATAFMDQPSTFRGHRRAGLSCDEVLEIRRQVLERMEHELAQPADVFLFSAEALSGFGRAELAAMRDWFLSRGHDLLVIAYIRPLKSFIESAFQQKVKGGLSEFRPEALYPNYASRFRTVDDVFGSHTVQLRKFSPRTLDGGCVVRDFCRVAGIKVIDASFPRLNESMSMNALQLLFVHRKFGNGLGVGRRAMADDRKIIQMITTIEGPNVRIAVDVARQLAARHQSDLAWMEQRLGASLRDGLEADASEEGAIVCEEDLLRIGSSAREQLEALLADEWRNRCRPGAPLQDIAACVDSLRHVACTKSHTTA